MATPKQIVRYGRNEMVQHEDTADVAITTGDLLERTATGVRPHTGQTSPGEAIYFAIEPPGMDMSAGDVYAAGDRVFYMACSGGKVWARLEAGQTVSRGTQVASSGDGTLTNYSTVAGAEATVIVGEAAHAADATGGAVYFEVEVTG